MTIYENEPPDPDDEKEPAADDTGEEDPAKVFRREEDLGEADPATP